ncbi:MAG: 30S ribosomal protein S21 [Candidatus Nealsonbacteria bacterium]|nr:30S ribosomal protein S21 [Candidatus Nealsonbacteria bacterium]
MSLEVKKQERENSQSLIRRFRKKVQKSGILLRARKIRFRQRSKNKEMRKRTALRKEKLKAEYEKLEKLGLSKK